MGKIVLEDFNEGNGYYKVNLAYLNKEQVEEIENLVSKWNPTDEDIKSCIAMCLTDVNEQRFKDYGTNLRDCLAWLERQGEQKPAEWSEEDERHREILLHYLQHYSILTSERESCINWLKSLRPQNRWKPSDKHIRFLQAMVNDPNNASSESCQIVLKDILEKLKKLKEE